jgi:hypothetical protein
MYKVSDYFDLKSNTEAEVQFELGRNLMLSGFKVLFERNIILKDRKTKTGRPVKLRADVVVFKNDSIVCLIEVKNNKRPSSNATKQKGKYTSSGIPFIYCWNEKHIDQAVKKVSEIYNSTQN